MSREVGRVGKPTGLSQAEPQEGLVPSGFDPSREALRDAARILCEFPKVRPDLFTEKKRAIGIWLRMAFWVGGIALGTVADYLLTGTTIPLPRLGFFLLGMLTAATLVYFDPPAIRNIYRLRDSDGSPEGRDACGSVHDSAGPKDIAQTASPEGQPQ